MNLNHLIYRNLKKNLKNYYLYVFALIFSVALYFAFVTLQYDPALDRIKGNFKAAAGIGAASVLLIVIVAVFLLYANTIFIKRRSREIGLFQLIGLTKGKIFRILSSENLILYCGSVLIGIFLGFSFSRLLLLILFRIIDIEAQAQLRFSVQALLQTVIVFAGVYILIMIMNYLFIKGQSILSLFHVLSTSENKPFHKMPISELTGGVLGLGLILYGYRISADLFSGDITGKNELFMEMIIILGSVILGTYLFYRGSVSLIFNLIRKSRGGYLSLNEVLSLSSIMFRMKSNALLLTIITTLSALAIGFLSLSYISYFSIETAAKQIAPHDFSFLADQDHEDFKQALEKDGIVYQDVVRKVLTADVDVSRLFKNAADSEEFETLKLAVIDEQGLAGATLKPDEAWLSESSTQLLPPMRSTGEIQIQGQAEATRIKVLGTKKELFVSLYLSSDLPVLVIDHELFMRLSQDSDPKQQYTYYGIDIEDSALLNQAHEIYLDKGLDQREGAFSQQGYTTEQKISMGLIMFIVAFLGLAFLITSGCILYFKQMGEGEDEKPGYTILRKLGFSQRNLLHGIQYKQTFNFGIPLIVGLSHSYFAVRSGWFFFGTTLWTPMLLVMLIYTLLYSIFGLLSVLYYKRLIMESL